MQKKTVALTGSSGTMGWAGFQELYAKKDQYNIVVLNRGSKKNREKFRFSRFFKCYVQFL